jgi:cathepsin B
MQQGVVTGGHYGSLTGCLPYQISPCRHGSKGRLPACTGEGGATPYCTSQCIAGDVQDWSTDKSYGYSGYRVGSGRNVEAIMKELYKRGSIQATFYIYADFLNYQSGVYTYSAGEMLGGHAVKLMGQCR